jgi:hypothetical protein
MASVPPDKIEQALASFMEASYGKEKLATMDTYQRIDLRNAFFAGALIMFTSVKEASEHNNEDICVARMELLNRELKRYAQEAKHRADNYPKRN